MPARRTGPEPLTLEALHYRLQRLEREPRLNRGEIEVVREQLAVLREQTPLTSGEISALRVLARAEVARLEARTRWRLRWSRWTTRQRLGFAMAVMVGLVTIANQIVSLLQGLMPVRPGP